MPSYGNSSRRTIFAGDVSEEPVDAAGIGGFLPLPVQSLGPQSFGGSEHLLLGEQTTDVPTEMFRAIIAQQAEEIRTLKDALARRPAPSAVIDGVVALIADGNAHATLTVVTQDALRAAVATLADAQERWQADFERRHTTEMAAVHDLIADVQSLFHLGTKFRGAEERIAPTTAKPRRAPRRRTEADDAADE